MRSGRGRKPATFDFLEGFTHICARSRRGKFHGEYEDDEEASPTEGLMAVAGWCQEHRHLSLWAKQLKTLNAKLRGHYQYYVDVQRTPGASGSSIGAVCKKNLAEVAQVAENSREGTDVGRNIPHSSVAILCCFLGSPVLGTVRGVAPEEPAAWKSARWGLCRGESVGAAMVDLNGHEAGNGRYSQGRPTARRVLLYSERCPW